MLFSKSYTVVVFLTALSVMHVVGTRLKMNFQQTRKAASSGLTVTLTVETTNNFPLCCNMLCPVQRGARLNEYNFDSNYVEIS